MPGATNNNDDHGSGSADAAKRILSMALSPADRNRMNELAERAAAGGLTADEEVEIEDYRQTTRLLELLKAKARAFLAGQGDGA